MNKTICNLINTLSTNDLNDYKPIPFWSWNDLLEKKHLEEQITWMSQNGFGGYFMHARSGLKTKYLDKDWFEAIRISVEKGSSLHMDSWAYDENGWPSGFVGGKLLENEENKDQFIEFNFGDKDNQATISYLIKDNQLIRGATESGNYLNLYIKKSKSTVDILNPEVTDQFINLTHEEYKKQFGNQIKGFFTDEPQYYRPKTPFTKMLYRYFKEKYNEDILDKLGLLFVDLQDYKQFRYRYYLSLQELMITNFGKKIYTWCENNNYVFTGHYLEESSLVGNMMCCAGIMPFYEYEHIPGIDNLGKILPPTIGPKQVYSVAAQFGKKQILTETFACCGWDITPIELKAIAETQYVNGVNLMCHHLLPYSITGQRKRDYPAFYSTSNPWVKENIKDFNEYFTRLGYLLANSEEICEVALFNPIRSLYFDYIKEKQDVRYKINDSYDDTIRLLSNKNIVYQIIDETLMEKYAKVEKNSLILGKCRYKYIIFPATYVLSKKTYAILQEYYKNGGKILFMDCIPNSLEGIDANIELKSNFKLKDIKQDYTIDSKKLIINSTYRKIEDTHFIYCFNRSTTEEGVAKIDGNFNGFYSLNLENLKVTKVSKELHFEPAQSYILFPMNKTVKKENVQKSFKLKNKFKVVDRSNNYLTIDKAKYSFDGKEYSEKLNVLGIFDEMLHKRLNGKLYLKYEFVVKDMPKSMFLLAEDMNTISTTINGKKIRYTGHSSFEEKIYKANIMKKVKVGTNEIVIEINFYQNDYIYYVLFEPGIDESLRNCLVYDTLIEAVYLEGDFGVFSEEMNPINDITYEGDNFYISLAKDKVENLLLDGFPFFSGNITLNQTYNYHGGPTLLELDGHYHLIQLKVNNKKVRKEYFSKYIDLKKYLVEGKNDIQISLTTSNRNLLGPHHVVGLEPDGICPWTFEVNNTWVQGKSELCQEKYRLNKFGLFNTKNK